MNAEGLQSILQLAEGDAAVLVEILDEIMHHTPQLMQDLSLAIDQADVQRVKRSAHSLKSSSAQIGALGMADLCQQLETKSGRGELDGAGPLLGQIYQAYAHVEREVAQWKSRLRTQ